jgi:hypothetical protein
MAEGPRAFGLTSPVGEVTILAGEFIRLAKSASVVVQDRGTDRFVGAVDRGRAMHLARKADRRKPAQRFTAESLMSAMAPANAVAQSSGFCSDRPARGRSGEKARASLATGSPHSSVRRP